ncbi:MAG: uncharacterized membrane protein YjgN (DUF898 family) [Candidatus Endobugula sp.]|jgi:uncharacterized membrane protein YjgN (DUF898 family)
MKQLTFEGNGSEYFKIWIVNILLISITLGLYYPWAKVRNHRYFYGNSTLEGRNFDYLATGKQLFVGYLIAMALFLVYVLVGEVLPLGAPVLLVVLFLAIPWIVWRSVMFNMRMTSFSNVRFGFSGKLGLAYINFLLLPLLFFVSAYGLPIAAAIIVPMYEGSMPAYAGGLIAVAVIVSMALSVYFFALMQKRNTSYLINGYRYGQGEFSTELRTGAFAKITLKTFGLSLLTFTVVMMLVGTAVALMGFGGGFADLAQIGNVENPKEMITNLIMGGGAAAIALGYIAMIFAVFFLMAYMQTRQRTYVLENTLLDNKVAFVSSLKARSLAWVMGSNFLLIILTLGLATPWAKVRVARLMLENTYVDAGDGFDQYVTQKQEQQSSLGEQIGDAFDVDIGVGI